MTKNELVNNIKTLIDPNTNQLINYDQVVNELTVEDDKVIIELVNQNDEDKNKLLNRAIVKFLKIDLGYSFVKLSFTEPKKEHAPQVETMTKLNAKFIAVMSGKGGVGKSKVTAMIAHAMVANGYKVGIIDCDIYGYSIPKILNLYGEPDVLGGRIQPLKTPSGIEVISTQYFIPDNDNKPIIWRATLLDSMMNHFFNDVDFSGDLDYIFIDMPPGTGDIALNLSKYVRNVDCYVVTTPNMDAAHVAVRAGQMAEDIDLNLRGIIENMAYYDHLGEKLAIFGKDGAELVAQELNSKVIMQLPITDNDQLLIDSLKELKI